MGAMTLILNFYESINTDAFVKSRKGPFFVIPAYEPESSIFKELQKTWTPFFNGVTTFYETIKSSFLVCL